MLDLGIDEMNDMINEQEKSLEKIFTTTGKYHNQVIGVLLMILMMKMYFDKSYLHILEYIKPQKKELSYALLLLSILLVVFRENEILYKAMQHGFFIAVAHLITESHSLTNLAYFAFIGMYHFNSVEVE